jgi:hypothetical protein
MPGPGPGPGGIGEPYGDGVPPPGRPGWSAELSAIMVFITAMSPPGFAAVVSSAPQPRQNL